jgi:hypothetical protein
MFRNQFTANHFPTNAGIFRQFFGFSASTLLQAIAVMNALEPPDLHHLRAASGWLLLGVEAEAAEDLKRIDPQLLSHPDVLEVRWQLNAKAQNWDTCLDIASAIVEIDPDRPSGWIGRAYSLRQIPARGLRAAFDALLPVAEKFPAEPMIPFGLACYACQMGDLIEGRFWLSKALAVAKTTGKEKRFKSMASDQPELGPLLPKIAERTH